VHDRIDGAGGGCCHGGAPFSVGRGAFVGVGHLVAVSGSGVGRVKPRGGRV
jgi:hypothetical protein